MSATPKIESNVQAQLETLIALARLLERVERQPADVGADQYRALVQRLTAALGARVPQEAMSAILDAHPASAELYENLHYDHAGLCRSPLELAVEAETLAKQTLARIAAGARG